MRNRCTYVEVGVVLVLVLVVEGMMLELVDVVGVDDELELVVEDVLDVVGVVELELLVLGVLVVIGVVDCAAGM